MPASRWRPAVQDRLSIVWVVQEPREDLGRKWKKTNAHQKEQVQQIQDVMRFEKEYEDEVMPSRRS